jgi:two-component system sensor histidine kinase YesM
MRKRLKEIYDHSTLVAKIRYSYLCLLVPFVLFLIFCFYNLWNNNRRYEDMVNSSVMASQFSLDFQKDFDYETYLLIVGNKTLEESSLHAMLEEADEIVAGLEELTESQENRKRLTSVKKYLNNLGTYIGRIEDNIREGNRYEDNIEIWENDVQIVTSLVGDTMSRYIYYEIRGIQESRQQYQDFFVNMIRFSVIAFALMLCLFLSYYIPLSITRPIRRLTQVTDQVAKGDLTVRSDVTGGLEARVLSDSMNTMIDKINELLEQVKTEQVRLRKAEFELLQSQINPHFLYNTLDAIVWLAEAGEQKKVVSMVGSLSDFFRISLNQGQDILDVREELQHVRSYLEIQQMRYQDILQYEICVPEELYSSRIPKITLQPLVENALYHGIKNKRGKGMIRIDGEMEDSDCILRITDNGRGMTPERLGQVREGIRNRNACETEIYGLYNVNERIRLNFGEKYGITITSTYGEGTCVTVRLPEYTL